MSETLELHDSEIDSVTHADGNLCVDLSHAYIVSEGKGWSQRARIHLMDGQILRQPSRYPATILDGFFENDCGRIDNVVPLPFSKPGRFTLRITFLDGQQMRLVGHDPTIELVGERVYIEPAP